MGSRSLVGWQVAEDEHFRRVRRSGVAIAKAELAHSVHVDVRGLRPGREYFYRFRVVDSIEVRDSPTSTAASFVVESGRPVIMPG